MRLFLANVLLMVIWVFLLEDLRLVQFINGFALGWIILYVFRGLLPDRSYFRHFWGLIKFLAYFAWKNILANFVVARSVLDPTYEISPGFVKINPQGTTPLQITWLAATISLIPGTLTVDTSEDDQYLYVHAMFVPKDEDGNPNPDEVRDEIKQELEPLILEFLDE